MEQRPLLCQEWTVISLEKTAAKYVNIEWQTPQGNIKWQVDTSTKDPKQEDIWHPHVVCTSRPEGIGRIVALQALQEQDTVSMPVASFDFAVLDSTTRRYEIAYDEAGFRAHFILGQTGRRAYLWEQMPYLLETLPNMISGWNSSQAKAVLGQVVECYEKWVRDVPKTLSDEGRAAWHLHVKAMLARLTPKLTDEQMTKVLMTLDDGQFFDAFEWAGFIEKKTQSSHST